MVLCFRNPFVLLSFCCLVMSEYQQQVKTTCQYGVKRAPCAFHNFSCCNIDHVFVKQQYKKILTNILSRSESVDESDGTRWTRFLLSFLLFSIFQLISFLVLFYFVFYFLIHLVHRILDGYTPFPIDSTFMSRRRAGYLNSAVRRWETFKTEL